MKMDATLHSPPDLERTYLKATLSWLDARLELEIRCWQLAGQDPSDRFRGLHISDSQALALAQRGVGRLWGSEASLSKEETKKLKAAQAEALQIMDTLEKEALKSGFTPRLKALETIFDLTSFEWWAFVICLAPSLELRYEPIYGYLQDNVTHTFASIDLILNLLLSEAGLSRLEGLSAFVPQRALRTFRLIVPVEETGKPVSGLRQSFRVEESMIQWLLGEYIPPANAEFHPIPEDAQASSDLFSLPRIPDVETILSVKPILSFHGVDMLQQDLVAQQFAIALERSLLSVKVQSDETKESAIEKLHASVRDANLLQALLYIQGCDLFIDDDGCLLPSVFEALHLLDDCVVLGSRRSFHFGPEMSGNDHPLMSVPFERLSAVERTDLWETLLEGFPHHVPRQDLTILAGQFNLTTGQIVATASSAMSRAVQDGRGLESADLFEAARLHSGHHLADMAHKIEPRYVWEDLVLPETPVTMLKEMVDMVKFRPMVLETWGLGRKLTAGAGVSALFSGPPGTGKTLAAQIMANQLGIDLYRIDLSTVVSKYIGETEKNLERIFREASESNAILFFDEADSIFGKRSEVKDAHDRYANIEVGYLLQRMEDYNGVAILATNLRANLDEAFTRRLQFIINFPFPDEEYRLKIWEVLMPSNMPCADDLDLHLLARRFKLAGGNIRNIIVSAAYLAAANGSKVEMPHLMHGARREFQKMGRLVNETDFVLPEQGVRV